MGKYLHVYVLKAVWGLYWDERYWALLTRRVTLISIANALSDVSASVQFVTHWSGGCLPIPGYASGCKLLSRDPLRELDPRHRHVNGSQAKHVQETRHSVDVVFDPFAESGEGTPARWLPDRQQHDNSKSLSKSCHYRQAGRSWLVLLLRFLAHASSLTLRRSHLALGVAVTVTEAGVSSLLKSVSGPEMGVGVADFVVSFKCWNPGYSLVGAPCIYSS